MQSLFQSVEYRMGCIVASVNGPSHHSMISRIKFWAWGFASVTCKGHESRNHNNHESVIDVPIENVVRESARESTPLITTVNLHQRRSIVTLVFIVSMILMLVSGVFIGSYLLFEQDKQWPMNIPYTLVKRDQWNAKKPKLPFVPLAINPAEQLLVLQTNTENCFDIDSCEIILHQIQDIYEKDNRTLDLPFNFLIGGDGVSYEGRGDDVSGDVDLKFDNSSIALAFIGNFRNKSPTKKQIEESQAFIFESITKKKIVSNYKVIFMCNDSCIELLNLWHEYFKLE